MKDSFFLSYGGLHWSYGDVEKMTIRKRLEFVEALENQLEFEKQELDKK